MDKRIVLFGAGANGQRLLKIISENYRNEILFCDNSPDKQNTFIQGVSVISFSEMCQCYFNHSVDKVVITVADESEMMLQCVSAGIDIKAICYFDDADWSLRPIYEKYSYKIYSIDGEEMYLKPFFGEKERGTYIDIGANHPFRFSNTFWAYSKGWRGINIEPDILNYEILNGIKDEDININCGISDVETDMDYYMFQVNALNTFCYDEIDNKNEIVGIRKVPMRRLDSILEEYNIFDIDFIDIDVEGMELQVLSSIDWNRTKISCILVEQRRMSLIDVVKSPVCEFLADKGYVPVSKYNRTVIYTK